MSQTWGYGLDAQPPRERQRRDRLDDRLVRGGRWPDQPPQHGQRRRPAPPSKRLGSRDGKFGVFVVIGSCALGAVGTVVTGREPGLLLGAFLIAGTLAGVSVVRPLASYLIIPVPAPAYLAAALAAGVLHGGLATMSHTGLAVSALQWTAGGFVPMALATVLAIIVAAARWRMAARPQRAR
jgi:hypothetical protein